MSLQPYVLIALLGMIRQRAASAHGFKVIERWSIIIAKSNAPKLLAKTFLKKSRTSQIVIRQCKLRDIDATTHPILAQAILILSK